MKHEVYMNSDETIDLQQIELKVVCTGALPDAPMTMSKQVIETDLRSAVMQRIGHLLRLRQISTGH